jgi:hypothetical protein
LTKNEMVTHLRMAAVNENTVTAMCNAYELGAEHERDVCSSIIFNMVKDLHLAQNIVDTIRVRE